MRYCNMIYTGKLTEQKNTEQKQGRQQKQKRQGQNGAIMGYNQALLGKHSINVF